MGVQLFPLWGVMDKRASAHGAHAGHVAHLPCEGGH